MKSKDRKDSRSSIQAVWMGERRAVEATAREVRVCDVLSGSCICVLAVLWHQTAQCLSVQRRKSLPSSREDAKDPSAKMDFQSQSHFNGGKEESPARSHKPGFLCATHSPATISNLP